MTACVHPVQVPVRSSDGPKVRCVACGLVRAMGEAARADGWNVRVLAEALVDATGDDPRDCRWLAGVLLAGAQS